MGRKLKVEDNEAIPEDEFDEEDLSEEEIEALAQEDASGIGLFAVGLLLGVTIGAGAVWLTAPARGDITRRRMKRKLRDLRDDARDQIEDWRDDARRGIDRQRSRVRRRLQRRAK